MALLLHQEQHTLFNHKGRDRLVERRWQAGLGLSPSLYSSQLYNTEEKILLALISPICRKLLAVHRGVDPPMELTNWAPALSLPGVGIWRVHSLVLSMSSPTMSLGLPQWNRWYNWGTGEIKGPHLVSSGARRWIWQLSRGWTFNHWMAQLVEAEGWMFWTRVFWSTPHMEIPLSFCCSCCTSVRMSSRPLPFRSPLLSPQPATDT